MLDIVSFTQAHSRLAQPECEIASDLVAHLLGP
jgi:hypothetical protein